MAGGAGVQLFVRSTGRLAAICPEFRYWLTDLSQYSDEEIKSRVQETVILQMSLLLLKYSQRADFGQRLQGILSLLWQLSEQETALEYLETVLRYITSSTDKVSIEELGQIVQAVMQEGADVMPTIAEQLLQQGREEGLQRGREEAALDLLRRYLATRFEVQLNSYDEVLAACDLVTLTQLSQVAFEANTLAEFEASLAKLTANQLHEQNGDAV